MSEFRPVPPNSGFSQAVSPRFSAGKSKRNTTPRSATIKETNESLQNEVEDAKLGSGLFLPPIPPPTGSFSRPSRNEFGLGDSEHMLVDEVERCFGLIMSVFIEGDSSAIRLRQRTQHVATELIGAVDSKLLFLDEIVQNKHITFETSLPGYVVKNGDAVVIVDGLLSVMHEGDCHRRLEALAAKGVKYQNFFAVPVFYPSGKLIGVIQCNSKRDGNFTWIDFSLLRSLAAFVGKAAANCRLMESLTEGQRRNRLLNKAAMAISSELAADQIFEKVSTLGSELVDGDRCVLYVLNDERQSLFTRTFSLHKKSTVEKSAPLDGLLGFTVRTNESLIVKDVAKDPRFKAFIARTGGDGVVDCMCVPAKNNAGETMGVVQVINTSPGRIFSKGDAERLGMLGSYAVIALENSKALDKASEMSVVSVSIMEKLDLNDTRNKIEEKTQELVMAQTANLFVMDEDSNELTGFMLVGRNKSFERVRIPVGKYPAGIVAATGQSMIVGDTPKDLKILSQVNERFGTSTRNMLLVPMKTHQGKVTAVVQACNRRTGTFTSLDENLLKIFMNSAGIALSNALKANELDVFLRSLKDLVARTGAVGSSLDFDTCLAQIRLNALEVVPAQAVNLHLVHPKTRALITKHGDHDTECASGTGIAGFVADSATMLNVGNCEEDARFHPKVDGVKGLRAESCMAAPILSNTRDKVIGVLQWVNKKGGKRFGILDENLATVFANIVSVAMLNTQSREEFSKEKNDLVVQCLKQQELLAIAQTITALPTGDAVAAAVGKHATQLLEAARCTTYLVDADTGELYMLGTDLRPKRFAAVGILGETVKQNKPFLIENVASHPLYNAAADQRSGSQPRNMVCVPICSDAKMVTGAIQVINKLKGEFNESDTTLLCALASLTATSLQRVSSLDLADVKNKFLKRLNCDLDLHATVTTFVDAAAEKFKAELCRFFLVDMVNSEMWTKDWKNKSDSNIFRVPLNIGIIGHVAVSARSVNVTDISQHDLFNPRVDVPEGVKEIRSMMCAPLEDRSGKVLGVIQVINRMNNTAFSDEDHEFLKQFSQIGGLVLKNALLFGTAMESKEYHRMLVGVSLRICSESSLEGLARTVCSRTLELLQVERCTFFARDPESKEAWLKWNDGAKKADKLGLLTGVAGQVVMTGEVSVALDEPTEADAPPSGAPPPAPLTGRKKFNRENSFHEDRSKRPRNILTAPVFAPDRSVIGLVQVSRTQGTKPFELEAVDYLKAVCDVVAVALSNTLNFEKLSMETQALRVDIAVRRGTAQMS